MSESAPGTTSGVQEERQSSLPGAPSTVSAPPASSPLADSSSTAASQAPAAKMAASTSAAAMQPPRLNPLPGESAPTAGMTASSTPLGAVNAARRPQPQPTFSSRGGMNAPLDIQERLKNFRLGRQGAPPTPTGTRPGSTNVIGGPGAKQGPGPTSGAFVPPSPVGTPPNMGVGGVPANFRIPNGMGKPGSPAARSPPSATRSSAASPKLSLAEKRGLKMPGGMPGSQSPASTPGGAPAGGRKKPGLTLSQMGGGAGGSQSQPNKQETALDKYSQFLDKKTGALKFEGKAILDSQGVKFAGGTSFSISLDEVDTLDELGKGNYGTVYKVRHSRPRVRRPGMGLAGNKAHPSTSSSQSSEDLQESSPSSAKTTDGTTGVVMAMKEMRLELDDAKFASIIMELDILHRCASPYIVEFYGAFFQEGAVYICMEYMDGGSVDKLYGEGVPEEVLRRITLATVLGLKSLKEEHNIIHRDIKPTNILVNTRGQVKICDFGVSGNLVASIAKTNIGCQSYMAPERISSGGVAQAGANPGGGTYSVQSDIWSLGLTIIECAMGRYPYPPETYNNIFSQLSAIVDGEPPDLPADKFSEAARNFVSGCLNKIPKLRATYAMLLQHLWLAPLMQPSPIAEEDEEDHAAAAAAAAASTAEPAPTPSTDPDKFGSDDCPGEVVDRIVADWVKGGLERRRAGKLKKGEKPALHAAPLDVVVSPEQELAQPPTPTTATTNTAVAAAEEVEVVQIPIRGKNAGGDAQPAAPPAADTEAA